MATVDLKKFTRDIIEYGTARITRDGVLTVPINARKKHWDIVTFLFETPKLRMPFGIRCFHNENEEPRFEISMSLDGYKDGDDCTDLYNALKLVDECNVDAAFKNSATWFKGKQHTRDSLLQRYAPIVIPSDSAPTIEGELRTYSRENSTAWIQGFEHSQYLMSQSYKPQNVIPASATRDEYKRDIKTPCFNTDRQLVVLHDLVTAGAQGKAHWQIVSLWFTSNNFGPMCIIQQMLVYPVPQFNTFAFSDDHESLSDDEHDGVAYYPPYASIY